MRIPALPKNELKKREGSWLKSVIARVVKPKYYRLPTRK